MADNQDMETIILPIAMAAHGLNAAYCRSLGDDSQLPWDDAPEWQRASAVNGVRFHLDNPEAGDSASHDNWMAGKLAGGWKFGPVKDEKKKEHPCMVAFDDLPVEQRFKDTLFRSIVHAMQPPLATLTAENEMLAARVAELEKQLAGAAKRASAAIKGDPGRKARKLGPIPRAEGEAEPTTAELLARVKAAGEVEIVASDGAREVTAIPVFSVPASAFKATANGLALTLPELIVHGPGEGRPAIAIAGYSLLLDGEQAAWRARPAPLAIGGGQQRNIAPDVIF